MDLMVVLTVSVFFLLSLTGAYILFKFLKSSAVVKTRKYRAGGAVGGFLLIYSMLYGSYYQMASQLADQLAKKQGPIISGTVSPKLPGGQVVLVVSSAQLGPQEKFSLRTPFNLDLKKESATVYLIAPPGEKFTDTDASLTPFTLNDQNDLEHVTFNGQLEPPGPAPREVAEGGQPR